MRSNNYAYVNGRFVLEAEATVSIFDRGFLYGDGVFETMRVYGGKIFRLYKHVDRMLCGLKVLQIAPQLGREEVLATLIELVRRNGLKDGMARIYVTRGSTGFGTKVQPPWQPTVVAMARPLAGPTYLEVAISTVRLDATSKLAGIKSANRLPYELAKQEARSAGFSDAVLLNHMGRIVELTTSNLFVVKKGELFTPPLSDGPLPGVTRDIVLTLAAKLGIPAHETSFGVEIFSEADEIFATNSLMEIEPIDKVADVWFRQHHIIIRLREAYRDFVREELLQS